MKKIYLSVLILIVAAQFSFAQWSTGSGGTIYYNSGNVGIGNSVPSYKLDVGGMLSSSVNGQSGLHMYNGGGVSEWLIQQKSQGDANFYISTLISNVQRDWFAINTGGSVAVGTNYFLAKFNVYQSTPLGSSAKNASLLTTVSGASVNNFQNNIWLVRNAAGSDWYTTRLHDGISIDGEFVTPQVDTRTWWERDPAQDIQSWGTATATYLTISQGNVGIGTVDNANWNLATSTYKLAVNGGAIATSMTVKLQGSWPDYVFKSDYQLPSLTEIKTYIDQNHHLPDMPSAQEVKKDGLNLGEINEVLTKKVEELTLYIIEQNKQLADQQKINQSLQNQINDLAKRIKN